MKQFSELFPIAAFLLALYFKDIYVATGVLMAATALQIALLLVLKHTITTMQWAVAGMVFVFGALTLGFHDERFIKVKPTVVYLAMAVAFFVSNTVFKKNLVQASLGAALAPPPEIWKTLNTLWIVMFAVMAVINVVLAYTVSTEIWAWSKMGFVLVTMLFIGAQIYVLRSHLKKPDEITH
jgi:intracellular septation protein